MSLSRRSLIRFGTTVPLLGLGLAACGTTEPAKDAPAASSSGGGPITVEDVKGKDVTLPKPATKVVALEWSSVDDVLSVGGPLIGITDIKGYGEWAGKANPLPAGMKDVGLRTTPSIDAVAALAPDLILGIDASIPDNALDQMGKIAPVLLLKGADATRPLDLMRQNHLVTGEVVGKKAQAEENLAAFDKHLDQVKAKLTPAADQPYLFIYPYVTGGQVTFRVHGNRSLPGAAANKAGLKNAWNEPGDDGWGLGTLDLEALTKIPENTRIFYWADPTNDPVKNDLSKNAVWTSIPAVKRGDVHPVAQGLWIYGGPKPLSMFIDQLVGVYA
ncbi:ABC transporter substrate-binding protein [Devriesea agamarum]|uniref:ABC transporter substrate-binding protein n=1 Tax=Devriesea agamarum TaxID=472569 RepID=UPI00071D3822|nr:iron-siderophore ABC transporter substrate-binding protein [Devriesea agamarum]